MSIRAIFGCLFLPYLLCVYIHILVCSVTQSCLTLCSHVDCSLAGPSVHGISQARIMEWLPFPAPGDLPDPGIKPRSLMSPALASRLFTTSTTWKTLYTHAHVNYFFRTQRFLKSPENFSILDSIKKLRYLLLSIFFFGQLS